MKIQKEMQHRVLIWALLFIIWLVYVIWEFQIQTWLNNGLSEMTRFDLILLPPLLAVTGSILYLTNKSNDLDEKR